jgi:hypothetical protein
MRNRPVFMALVIAGSLLFGYVMRNRPAPPICVILPDAACLGTYGPPPPTFYFTVLGVAGVVFVGLFIWKYGSRRGGGDESRPK